MFHSSPAKNRNLTGRDRLGPAGILAAIVAVPLLLYAMDARAEFPFPADPNRCDASGQPLGCTPLPNEMSGSGASCNGLMWKYASTAACTTDPLVLASPNELFGVSGASVDVAWRLTTGRPDVVIAVLDSGMKWNDLGAMSDLRKKFYLNRGELPLPANCVPPGNDPFDCNGDGAFNMPDYDADPSVGDQNGNGITDPEDLILLFSDGVDDDGDGYVDNICGWDFFQGDNNPFDDVQFGHGTGEARDSAAEANNAGDLGTCPNCLTMPVRVGDSFIADVNSFAQGVIFAVDTGAAVVQEALGTLNNTRFGQQAVTYAYNNNVPVIASAADEDAWHHNYPSNYVHTIVVNSIRDFGVDGVEPDSWLYVNGCTNFGGNIGLSVPSTSCSSEATGRSSGMTALVVSAGRDAVDAGTLTHPLTANEVRQILERAADDVDFENNRAVTFPDTVRYASQAGWDQFFGYGRINAEAAVAAVRSGAIPPEAEIDEPVWFQYLDPTRDGAFDVRGRVAADRATGYVWRLQIAYGVQPKETDWVDIVPFGAVESAPIEGVIATITAADIPAPTAEQIARRQAQLPDLTSDYDEFTYTLRLQVLDQPGGRLGEDRRTIFIHHDPDLPAPYPLQVGDGASSPALADLDGDGALDIVFGTADGLVHAKRADGSDLPGWPAATDPLPLQLGSAAFLAGAVDEPVFGAVLASVAVGDIDGDGLLDVVAADLEGKVYAWDHRGRRKSGFPVGVDPLFSSSTVLDPANTVDVAIIGSPALADLDGDGGLDIIVGGNDRHIYVWDGSGAPRPGFPVLVVDPSRMAAIDPVTHKATPLPGAFRGSKIMTSPAIGDIDGDGSLDIVVGTNEAYEEEANMSLSSGTAAALADSGILEPGNSRVYAIHSDGNQNPAGPFLSGWPVPIGNLVPELLPDVGEGVNASPALADVDGDGTLEVGVFSVVGPAYLLRADGSSFYGTDTDGKYRVMATDGYPASNSPDTPSIPSLGEGAFGDLTGTGQLAFAAPAGGLGRLLAVVLPDQQVNADDHIAAWVAATGEYLAAFPRHVEDLQFITGPTIADVGGTALPEVIEASAGYFVHAYDATGAEPSGWPKFTGGWHVANIAAGDVDGDGFNEAVALTREGNLYVWNTLAASGPQEWPMKRHDVRNTGNYEEPAGQTASAFAIGDLRVARLAMRLVAGERDRLRLRARPLPDSASDGIDPAAEGLAFDVDDVAFSIPAAAFTRSRNGRVWRYRDRSGAGSSPPGLVRVILRARRNGELRLVVKGRDLDLSSFEGGDDRSVSVSAEIANDRLRDDVALRRSASGSLRGP